MSASRPAEMMEIVIVIAEAGVTNGIVIVMPWVGPTAGLVILTPRMFVFTSAPLLE